MNNSTLRFFNSEIEIKYQTEIFCNQFPIFARNMYVIIAILIAAITYNFLSGLLLEGVFGIVLLFQILLIIIFSRKSSKFFDWFCLAIQLCLNCFFLLIPTLSLKGGGYQDYNTYSSGYAMAYISQSFNIGSRFPMKMLTILVNVFSLLSLIIYQQHQITIFNIVLILSSIMAINQIYQMDKKRREAFSIQINENIWLKNLNTIIDVCIIQCKYKENTRNFQLIDANQCCQKIINVFHNESFKEFIRNSKICELTSDQSIKLKQVEKQISLEQFIYLKLVKEKGSENLISFEKSIQYQNCIYQTQLFSFLSDEKRIALLISRKDQLFQLQLLKAKQKLRDKVLQTNQIQKKQLLSGYFDFFSSIQQIFNENILNQQQKKKINQIFGNIRYNLYRSLIVDLNSLFYFRPQIKMSKYRFKLNDLIQNLKNLFKFNCKQRKIKFTIKNDPDQILNSDYRIIFHIIFNIIEIVLKNSKNPGCIFLKFEKQVLLDQISLTNNLLNITIETDVVDLKIFKQTYIRIINPTSISCLNEINNRKCVDLDLCIATHLVGVIGPYNKIEVIQSFKKMKISFKIFINFPKISSFFQKKEEKA